MISRAVEKICFSDTFGRQMRFIAGPRQVGKTTLAKIFLKRQGDEPLYYNWDKREIRQRFKKEPYFFRSDTLGKKADKKRWVCMDEIHKYPKWKDILKDYFDSFEEQFQFIITGSARLDLFRKSGDSLSGRYFLFRLLPLSLFEILNHPLPLPTKKAKVFIEENIQSRYHQSEMEHLIRYSGFPEPFSKGDEIFSSNWHREYVDSLIKEDLRDLTKIHDLENVATLMTLLPERVGSPLSINSLREDIEVSHNAARNYLRSLILTYIVFEIPPYTKKIQRALRKEKKIYFFDWSLVTDPAKRFENYVAVELKNRVELWNVATAYKFEIYFLRSRDGRETDFLITRNQTPYFLVEAKITDSDIASHNIHHAKQLGNIPLVQLVYKPDILKVGKENHYVISASRFL